MLRSKGKHKFAVPVECSVRQIREYTVRMYEAIRRVIWGVRSDMVAWWEVYMYRRGEQKGEKE